MAQLIVEILLALTWSMVIVMLVWVGHALIFRKPAANIAWTGAPPPTRPSLSMWAVYDVEHKWLGNCLAVEEQDAIRAYKFGVSASMTRAGIVTAACTTWSEGPPNGIVDL